MRRLALGAAAAAIVFTLASCSVVDPEAARFGSLSVGQREFEGEIAAFAADKDVRDQLSKPDQSGNVIAPAYADGKIATTGLSGFLLTREATYQAVHQLAGEQGVVGIAPATDADATTDSLPQGFGAVWPHLPSAVRARWSQAVAERKALIAQMSGPVPDEAAQRAFFETVKDRVNGATFEQVQAQLIPFMQQQPFTKALNQVQQRLDIRIDPRYGSWGSSGYVPTAVPLAGRPAAPPTGS